MSNSRKKRSAWIDLVIAGLIGSLLPATVAWRSGTFSHSEAVTRQADDQAYRLQQLQLERDKLLQQSCANALAYLGDENPNPAVTPEEARTLALAVRHKSATDCRLALPTQYPQPVPQRLLPAPTKEARP